MLDTEVLKHLPDQYKERLVEFEKVFSSKGWEYICEYAEKSAEEQRDRMLFAQNWDQYLVLHTKWNVFTELSALEETTLKEFENIARQAMEDALAEVEIEYE